MGKRERFVRNRFDIWIHKKDTNIQDLFEENAVYIVKLGTGISAITWSMNEKTAKLQEHGCNTERYGPYADGDIPAFREEKAL